MINKIKKFFVEVVVELKKVSWSTKKELIDSSWIVVISTGFLIGFIALTDFILTKIIGIIIK